MDRYPIYLETIEILENLNIFFITIFTLELILKLTAYGIKNFFKESAFSYFDTMIVLVSLADVIVS